MEIRLTSSDAKELGVNFDVNGRKVIVKLSKDSVSYRLTILRGGPITVKELITICNLIYSQKIIDEKDCISIYFKNSEPTFIHGNHDVTSAILSTLKVGIS